MQLAALLKQQLELARVSAHMSHRGSVIDKHERNANDSISLVGQQAGNCHWILSMKLILQKGVASYCTGM